MIKKQKVFIPTDTSNYNEGYKTQFELCDNIKSIGWYNGEKREHLGATHWLKEQEGYFFTTDELENFSIGLVERMANEISKESASFSSEKVYKEYVETLNKK